jgi:hypothetical protein
MYHEDKERNHRRYDVPRGLRQYCAGGRWQQTPTISGGRTSELPTQVALNELHVLPSSIGDLIQLRGLEYLKTMDKVFLVIPANRIVVDAIAR